MTRGSTTGKPWWPPLQVCEVPNLWSYDLTRHAEERLKEVKPGVGVSLRAMTSGAAWPDPHPLGPCISFHGTGAKNRGLAPYLCIEPEETNSGAN